LTSVIVKLTTFHRFHAAYEFGALSRPICCFTTTESTAFGRRSFSSVASTISNGLSADTLVRKTSCDFNRQLKTQVFTNYFNIILVITVLSTSVALGYGVFTSAKEDV